MRPSIVLKAHREQIRAIITNHHAENARVFGSVVRGEDTDSSDLDVLIDPTPETSLMDIGAIQFELKAFLNIDVDALTPNALPEYYQQQVLREAVTI